jgi:hypothetical protein
MVTKKMFYVECDLCGATHMDSTGPSASAAPPSSDSPSARAYSRRFGWRRVKVDLPLQDQRDVLCDICPSCGDDLAAKGELR